MYVCDNYWRNLWYRNEEGQSSIKIHPSMKRRNKSKNRKSLYHENQSIVLGTSLIVTGTNSSTSPPYFPSRYTSKNPPLPFSQASSTQAFSLAYPSFANRSKEHYSSRSAMTVHRRDTSVRQRLSECGTDDTWSYLDSKGGGTIRASESGRRLSLGLRMIAERVRPSLHLLTSQTSGSQILHLVQGARYHQV